MKDLDSVITQQHRAVDEFVRGHHEPLAELWSRQDDVTLGNPFGPFVRGFEPVVQTMRRAASLYADGMATSFEEVSRHVAADMAYIVEVERFRAKVGPQKDVADVSLRCTSIFRREQGHWRLVHRHADPITTPQSADSVIRG